MCGGGEIRTPEGFYTLPPFQGSALDRYATPPYSGNINLLKAYILRHVKGI